MKLAPRPGRPAAATGAIVIPLLLILFTASLAAAGFVGRLLWQDADRSWPRLLRLAQTRSLAEAPTPMAVSDDPLLPSFTVDSALTSEYAELERQLWQPLRAYYATKEERLGDTVVTPSDQSTHSVAVTFQLIGPDGAREHRFYYDREGSAQDGPYPKWEPGMLDVTK